MVRPAFAQEVTSSSLTANYILAFARFTTWPDGMPANGAPFRMCVLGDSAVSDDLARTINGRQIFGHEMVASAVTATDPLGQCHVLYISNQPLSRVATMIRTISDTSVLTISDINGFLGAGGIGFVFPRQGALRFWFDVPAARRAQLQISSQLLAMAERP